MIRRYNYWRKNYTGCTKNAVGIFFYKYLDNIVAW